MTTSILDLEPSALEVQAMRFLRARGSRPATPATFYAHRVVDTEERGYGLAWRLVSRGWAMVVDRRTTAIVVREGVMPNAYSDYMDR